MRGIVHCLGGVAMVVAALGAGAAHADMTLRVAGSDAGGAAMQASCDLRPLAPPSNTFLGQCELTLGGEHLTLVGIDVDGQPVLSVVLDGRITIRGLPRSTSQRFLQLVKDGAAGFPIYLHVDPLGRAWALERDIPGGGREAIGGGALSEGQLGLGIQ